MSKSAKEIFGPMPTGTRASEGRLFRQMKRKPAQRKLNIKTRPCKSCGETTTSLTNYTCPRKHFGGWWGRWEDMEPCQG